MAKTKAIEKTKTFGADCKAALDWIDSLRDKKLTGYLHSALVGKEYEFSVTWKVKA